MDNKEKAIRICTDVTVQTVSNMVSTICDLAIPTVMVTGSVSIITGTVIASKLIKTKSKRYETQSFINILNNIKCKR